MNKTIEKSFLPILLHNNRSEKLPGKYMLSVNVFFNPKNKDVLSIYGCFNYFKFDGRLKYRFNNTFSPN